MAIVLPSRGVYVIGAVARLDLPDMMCALHQQVIPDLEPAMALQPAAVLIPTAPGTVGAVAGEDGRLYDVTATNAPVYTVLRPHDHAPLVGFAADQFVDYVAFNLNTVNRLELVGNGSNVIVALRSALHEADPIQLPICLALIMVLGQWAEVPQSDAAALRRLFGYNL